MRALTAIALALLLAVPMGSALAQPQAGYVDFGDLTELEGSEPLVEVSLGSALLGFLATAAAEDEPELADALGKLRAIRLTVFELDDTGVAAAKQRTRDIIRRLESEAWEPAVSVRSDDANIHIYMKMNGAAVAGMTVLTVGSDGEAIFMNIVGEIDPTQLGRVASRFGVDLDDVQVGNDR